jgi:hypothetical protein
MRKELEEKLAPRRARSPVEASDHPGVERLPSTLGRYTGVYPG